MTARKTDAGQAEVQQEVDKAEDKGFLGTKADPIPNERYSLETGPESPTVQEQRKAEAEADAKENE